MNQEQYAAAYQHGYPKTIHFMLSRGISRALSEELAQAAWARGWECREQVRDVGKVNSWVNSIALNLLRSSFRRARTSELPADMAVTPQTSPQTIDAQRLLMACSAADRKLIEGYYMAGYTSFELGRQLGCSAVAVRVRLLRLRRRLQTAVPRQERVQTRANAA